VKHIPTFESFINESSLNEWKKAKAEDLVHDMKVKITRGRHAGVTGIIHDFQLTDGGELVDDQIDVLVDRPGKPFAYLGIDDIMVEAIDPESGMMGLINTALGPRQGRLVVIGDNVEKHQEKILDAIRKIDKDSRVEFFAKTGKIVGVIAATTLKDLQKELRRIDSSLMAEIKAKSLK
jgi:hypothetical protein